MTPQFIVRTSAYEFCLPACGRDDDLGAPCPANLLDGSGKPTTIDQLRIEAVLEAEGVEGLRILHVGAGNSSLASRFAVKAAQIVAVTLARNEKVLAESLHLPNYTVLLANKYSSGFPAIVGGPFELIVDNNMASFACCQLHFHTMLASYSDLLVVGGRVITDQRGMDWTAGDSRWKLSWEDLAVLGARYPFRAEKVTDTVYVLRRV